MEHGFSRSGGRPFRNARLILILSAVAISFSDVTGCRKSNDSPGDGSGALEPLPAARQQARAIDDFLINYGSWDDAEIAVARKHQLVVVHPKNGNVTRSQVAAIQGGGALVLAYVSIGEDLRTRGLSDDQMRGDPRFIGDGTGPRIDPRGHLPRGGPLEGISPLGSPSTGGSGWASWYLDDNSVDRNGAGDGMPDRNARFGACFVNAGDPKWFDVVRLMTLDGRDGVAGFEEAMTLSVGRGLGCDGVFLDTIDTCAPNAFTDASSPNQSEFEWTAPGFQDFIRRVRQTYPDKIILQNRGLFFFDPRHPHYKFTTRGSVDVVLFESFRLNSNTWELFDPYFFPDNRYNIAPKLMAEANRPDGFRVVSLGYAEGPPDQISKDTLLGGSTVGLETLLEDIRVTERENGFRHYISDGPVELVNSFVHDHADRVDHEPPVWSNTYNANTNPVSPAPPTQRFGIQEAVPGPGSLTVRWDVALDLNPVRYALYYQTTPFDLNVNPKLTGATRVVLQPSVGKGYENGVGPTVFAHEATVGGLRSGQTYYLIIRAFDTSPQANEDGNGVTLSATPQ